MNFRELYDVSVSLSPQLAVWPGDPAIEINKASQISQGANANVTQLSIGAHIGTHVDAPVHFIDGATGVDQFPLEALVGPAHVVNFTFLQHDIGAADLENANLPRGTERVLFKTRNSAFWQTDPTRFHRDYIALAADGAQWLVDRGVKLVGIDYLSIETFEPFESRYVTHHILLDKRVVVVEGLDLSRVEPGEYTVMALPIKIKDGDGAPARVLLAR